MSTLRDAIREALDESDSPDPYEVAALADAKIGSRDVREALRELLPDAVREMIRQQRGTAPTEDASPVNGKRDLGEMARDQWRMRAWVPDFGWKFRGDLTADDLEAQAADYERRADEMESRAKGLRLEAQRMREVGASTLRDLYETSEVAA